MKVKLIRGGKSEEKHTSLPDAPPLASNTLQKCSRSIWAYLFGPERSRTKPAKVEARRNSGGRS